MAQGPSERIRVLVVEDETIVRAGLAALLHLEADFEVVGEVGNGSQAVEQVKALRPDVVLMDLAMPGMDGLEATRQITALELPTRVLVLSSHSEDEDLLPVLAAGGVGYVRKTDADEDLIRAIRSVALGEVSLYPRAMKRLVEAYRKASQRDQETPREALSEREREVLALTAQGFSSRTIAKKLFLSPKTVDTYRGRLTRKLGFHDRAELVQFALRNGLLKEPAEPPAAPPHRRED